MKLLRLDLKNIRNVPDGSYALADARTGAPLDVVLITGAPAAGKTSFLEAIVAAKEAVGAYGAPVDLRRLLRRGASAGRIEATWLFSESERARAGLPEHRHTTVCAIDERGPEVEANALLRPLFRDYSYDPAHGKFEYFPANRRLCSQGWRPATTPISEHAEARLRMTRDPEKYAGLRGRLRQLALQDAERTSQMVAARGVALRGEQVDALAPFRAAVAAFLPDLRLEAVDLRDPTAVWFLRRARTLVELEELTESEQQGALFALAFPRFGLNHSVVLVDNPELHLHPGEHARVAAALAGGGHDNQIIAATTSRDVLGSTGGALVIDLSNLAPGRNPAKP